MKKYFLIAGLILISTISNSQVIISLLLGDKLNSGKIEFGLAGGVNWATIKNLPNANTATSFNLGFYFDFKLKHSAWMLNTGVIVKSPMGAKDLPLYSLDDSHLDSAFAGGSINRKLRYFNVPFTMKYTFKNHFFVKGGIMLALKSKCFDEFVNSKKEDDDLVHKVDIKHLFRTIDGGLTVGIGYRLMKGNGMNLDLQYYHGLVDITIDNSTPDQFNRGLYLTAGIPIGKNPKKNKE